MAVISVTATWAGLPGSPLAFTHGSGAVWTATFGPFSGLGASYSQDVTLTVTARDAAGNARSAAVVVHVWGTCLI